MAIASSAAVFTAVAGTYFSYFLNGETGAYFVLTQATVLTLATLFGPKYGILSRARAPRHHQTRCRAAPAPPSSTMQRKPRRIPITNTRFNLLRRTELQHLTRKFRGLLQIRVADGTLDFQYFARVHAQIPESES